MPPLLSIVLPVRNEGENLEMVCRNILQQKYRDLFEVVIIDDSDPQYRNHVSKCLNFLKEANVKTKYISGNKRGVGDAMLAGLKACEGVYVFFLDADNVLSENFMNSVIPHLMDKRFVSFYSTAEFQRGLAGLFYAKQVGAVMRKGLKFNRRFGFVNILYIWRRDLMLSNARVVNPRLSLLDQIDLISMVNTHILNSNGHIHINDVLVRDIRHAFESFDPWFIYRRLLWYYGSYKSFGNILRLKDVKSALISLLIIAAFLSLLIIVFKPYLLYILVPYLLAIITSAPVKTRRSLFQMFIGIIWLPTLLAVKASLILAVIFKLKFMVNKHD